MVVYKIQLHAPATVKYQENMILFEVICLLYLNIYKNSVSNKSALLTITLSFYRNCLFLNSSVRLAVLRYHLYIIYVEMKINEFWNSKCLHKTYRKREIFKNRQKFF